MTELPNPLTVSPNPLGHRTLFVGVRMPFGRQSHRHHRPHSSRQRKRDRTPAGVVQEDVQSHGENPPITLHSCWHSVTWWEPANHITPLLTCSHMVRTCQSHYTAVVMQSHGENPPITSHRCWHGHMVRTRQSHYTAVDMQSHGENPQIISHPGWHAVTWSETANHITPRVTRSHRVRTCQSQYITTDPLRIILHCENKSTRVKL